MPPNLRSLLAPGAKARNLDLGALLAIAGQEGASGRIGDGGHAFGPFQTNDAGGVLTGKLPGLSAQQKNAWAWSPAGINFALNGIAGVAKGLRGPNAVRAIVGRYERPADIPGETSRALGSYGSSSAGGVLPSATPAGSVGGAGNGVLAPGRRNPAMLASLLASTQQAVGLPSVAPGLLQSLIAGAPNSSFTGSGAAGAVGTPPSGGPTPTRGLAVARTAKTQLGQPYQWGGPAKLGTPTDCSGLLQASLAANGVHIGRTTYKQFRQGKPVGRDALQAGDAVFFHAGPLGPEHVGIYVGNGRFIEDPHTGATVRVADLAKRGDFVGARRYT